MHGAVAAVQVRPAAGQTPGVCQVASSSDGDYGFFVPYRKGRSIGGLLEQWDATIDLLVLDLSRELTVPVSLPFVIDCAADVTIIPRKLLPRAVFPMERSVWPFWVPVTGLAGGERIGLSFDASIAIVAPEGRFGALSFGLLTVVVVNDWPEEHGTLGLDALRRVLTVSDSEHVSFWRLGNNTASSPEAPTDYIPLETSSLESN